MFIAYLKTTEKKDQAARYMDEHNRWIAKGFADGVFLSVGSITSGGGAVIAHGESFEDFKKRIESDPFVANDIVVVEIEQVDVKRAVPELEFLKTQPL